MNTGPVILCVDVPAELSGQIQLLARKAGIPTLLIHVAGATEPPVTIPFVRPSEPLSVPTVTLPNDSFQLLEPVYDCKQNEVTFRSVGGFGVEYMAPGVTGWTGNPGPHRVDAPVVNDGNPLTLHARIGSQHAAPYVFDFAAYCQKPQ